MSAVESCESRLSVHIRCSELRNMDFIGRSDPFCYLFQDPTGASHLSTLHARPEDPPSAPSTSVSVRTVLPTNNPRPGSSRGTYPGRESPWELIGKTETIPNSLNPSFATSFEIPYFFERNQKLAVDVFDRDADKIRDEDLSLHDYLGSAEVSVAALVRARGQRKKIPLKIAKRPHQRCGFITILVEEVTMNKLLVNYDMFLRGLTRVFSFRRGHGPYLTISRQHEGGVRQDLGSAEGWITVFRTAVVGTPVLGGFDIGKLTYNYEKLCRCDDNVPLRFQVSYERHGKHKVVAQGLSTLAECDAKNGVIKLQSVKGGGGGCFGSAGGDLLMKNRHMYEEVTFLDYVIGGCEISLVVAIDFTASNGDPAQPGSLHFWDEMQPNEYESAIRAVGDILAFYDSDQSFPAYGFGAKLPPEFDEPYHKFSLTDGPDPTCQGIDEVLDQYRQTLLNVRLSGPTVFAEVIRAAAEHATAELQRYEQSYTILLVVTDGVINDMEATLEEIARASSLPLSIVIIGVGNEDFSDMIRLDGDGEDRERDIVQFVNFRKVMKAPEVLQSQVLEEIPTQFLQYMQKHRIKPNPRPVD
eukprot:GFKZ01013209.1.p1 GENE.GFKZ01013209.1~~GFKZ01013209.1.p1  ORF type:complete len:584 (-),score=70.92 GFKZ01013209.1:701-2452(-)